VGWTPLLYRLVLGTCNTRRKNRNSTFSPYKVLLCCVWVSEELVVISSYIINWLLFMTEGGTFYYTVRTEFLNIIEVVLSLFRADQAVPLFISFNFSWVHISLHLQSTTFTLKKVPAILVETLEWQRKMWLTPEGRLYTGWSKNLCSPDDYSTKNNQKYFKQFQSPW
jgi:hypothetical protein